MKRFQHQFRVHATQEAVAQFHGDVRVLKLLTPPPMLMKFNKVEPLHENAQVDFTIWVGPLPIHWVARHSNLNPPDGFTDIQITGPFKDWIHQHTFKRIDAEVTEIIDEVRATPSNHIVWGIVSRIMWFSLPLLFAYRQWKTKRILESRK